MSQPDGDSGAPSGAGGRPELGRLLRPASIAAIGGAAARETIRQCRRMGYAGRIYPVHPRESEVDGLPAYPTVSALPEAPDAAFVGVNRHATLDVLRALAERGAGGAVSYAAGFREAGGDGARLQAEFADAAGSMPVLGPNCYGIINYLDGALLWPDQHGGVRREGGVALVAQSSNIAINLTMNRCGLPVAYMVTLGNQAKTGVSDVIPALVADTRVRAVGVLVEGLDDIHAFAAAAQRAHEVGVPVVVLRAGRSETGQGLALSHTASMGGVSRLASARLAQLGVAEVDSLSVFLETLKLLHAGGPLVGRDVASLSCSGGEAILMADAGQGRNLRFPDFTPAQREAVEATVSELVTVSNPFDYHTFMWGDAPAMAETFTAVMRARFDITCLILDLPRGDRCDDSLWRPSMEGLLRAQAATGSRAALVATMPEGLPEDVAARCLENGVAPLIGLENALAAIATAADLGERRAAAPVAPQILAATGIHAESAYLQTLTEPAAKRALAASGVPVPDGRCVSADGTGGAASAAAHAIGFPVAVKAVSAELAHKTEADAVALNLDTDRAVRETAGRLGGLADTLLVERMVSDAVAEVLVGYQHDPVMGAFLVVGSGGVLVELVGDRAVLPLPATRGEIERALDSLRVAKLLRGYRGRPAGDTAALVDAIAAVGGFCAARVDRLHELDVNPILVRPAGHGVVAADALVRERIPDEQGASA